MEFERLSALRTGCLYPPADIASTHFYYSLSRPQDHSAVGRITSVNFTAILSQSQWPSSLKCGSVAARLPGSWDRNQHGERMLCIR